MIEFILLIWCVYSQTYEEWLQKYNKKYDSKRELIFYSNLEWINSYNSKYNIPQLTIDNEFADLDPLEFKDKYIHNNMYNIPNNKINRIQNHKTNNKPIDWIKYMQPIQHQGRCGSCYAFAMTSAMEGYIKIHHNKTVKLSEQYIVDCIKPYGYSNIEGCSGATDYQVLDFGMNNGFKTEDEYGFYNISQTKAGKCKESIYDYWTDDKKYYIEDYETYHGEGGYESGLQYGPLYVAIRADPYLLQFREPGSIINDPDCNNGNVDHAVTLVGWDYDSKTNQEFWIFRNSWGSSWGNAGYGYIVKGKNMCKIEDLKENEAILPIVSGTQNILTILCLLICFIL